MYGDGSDGPLVVTGTTDLALDTKHQFTTVDIQTGARLEASGVGSVLYICATESINIDGTVVAWNTQRGQNSLSVTIDGITYTSPGTANGGKGGDNLDGATGGVQGLGFGGGGSGGGVNLSGGRGGNGGNGGTPGGTGGASSTAPDGAVLRNNGGVSSGGSGVAVSALGYSGTSGRGGHAYGSNGLNGSVTNATYAAGGGGGGAGGNAGTPGVHIVLKSPSITMGGTVYTRVDTQAADGTRGGAGGTGSVASNGSGGGGGGGGNAGNIYLAGQTVNHSSAFLGIFGGGGGQGGAGYQAGASGASGTDGVLYVTNIIPPQPYGGPFYRAWDGTEWQYVSGKVFNESVFKPSKPTIL